MSNIDDHQGFERILSAIFETSDKPALGKPPARFSGPVSLIAGLTRVDDLVLCEIARMQIEENAGLVMFDALCAAPALTAVPAEELVESLEILGQKYFINISYAFGVPVSHVVLTTYGFQEYAEAYVNDYDELVSRIAALLVNEDVCHNNELAERLERPVALVDFILDFFESQGHIKMSKYMGGMSQVWQIAPSLKRALVGS